MKWLLLIMVAAVVSESVVLCVMIIKNAKLKKESAKLQEELDQNNISIMLSQIQPHFLYNSLSAIRELCIIHPEEAPKALEEFSLFLRGNMDSLKSSKPVHFTRELEHVRHYLHLEKIRFGEDLNIVYDIQVTDFFLPTLTVQPIVENAVKYGVGNKEDGGTVTISTRKTGDRIVVTISDDGVGFDADDVDEIPVQADGRTHIGMSNVKKRLKAMVNGDMVIHSRKDTGTIVEITLCSVNS